MNQPCNWMYKEYHKRSANSFKISSGSVWSVPSSKMRLRITFFSEVRFSKLQKYRELFSPCSTQSILDFTISPAVSRLTIFSKFLSRDWSSSTNWSRVGPASVISSNSEMVSFTLSILSRRSDLALALSFFFLLVYSMQWPEIKHLKVSQMTLGLAREPLYL